MWKKEETTNLGDLATLIVADSLEIHQNFFIHMEEEVDGKSH